MREQAQAGKAVACLRGPNVELRVKGRWGRKVGKCAACGETVELAQVEPIPLCYAHYRAEQREKRRLERNEAMPVDRHAGAIKREHKKLIHAYANMLAAWADFGVSRDDILDMMVTMEPYVAPIQQWIVQAPEEHPEAKEAIDETAEEDSRDGEEDQAEGEL
jgi:hypothetical protein